MRDAVKRIADLALGADDFGQRVLEQVAQECREAETPAELADALARTRALSQEAEEGAEAERRSSRRPRGRSRRSPREVEHRLARKVARRGGGSAAEAHRFAAEVTPVRRDVPAVCGTRHRRASGSSSARCRGSRRSTGGSDPGDDGSGEPEPSEPGGDHRDALRGLVARAPGCLPGGGISGAVRPPSFDRRPLPAPTGRGGAV